MADNEQLRYIVNHVFLPPKLPQADDFDITKEHALCMLAYKIANLYTSSLSLEKNSRWHSILKMLKNIPLCHETKTLSTEQIVQSMKGMQPGDVLPLLIRAQNAGIIMRYFENEIIFESFEASPQPGIVIATKGKLLCSYPGPAIAVPRKTVDDPAFRQELASFLVQMNADALDSAPTTKKAKSVVVEERDTVHPRYITQLLTEILRGMGQVADVTRIRKRIADDVLWLDTFKPWRRSSMWLLIRVALQTSLHRVFDEHDEYKRFMVFMMAKILRLCLEEEFPSDLVFCIRAKISRRLLKLSSATQEFVLEYVRDTGNMAQVLLQQRWTKVQMNQAECAYWAPDCLGINADTHLTLLKSKSYLSQVVHGPLPPDPAYTFRPDHFRRFRDSRIFSVSQADLLAAFTKNTHIGLLDFETAVQDHLDSWVNVNLMDPSGCTTIATCIVQYYGTALAAYKSNPEAMSVMLLTIFELWVGLDKIAVTQCTLLREYSPEFPLDLLETLLLRRSSSFGRPKSIMDYLLKRHSNAVCGSVFTDAINKFAIRYYDTSERHHSLREHIEKDAAREQERKVKELEDLNGQHQALTRQAGSLEHDHWSNKRGRRKHRHSCTKCSLESQASKLSIDVFEWPLPQDLLELKTVVFELRPPVQFSVWRSTTYKILRDICMLAERQWDTPSVLLDNYPALKKYNGRNDQISQSRITLASSTKSFLNSHYRKRNIPSDKASVCVNNGLHFRLFDKSQNEWVNHPFDNVSVAKYCTLQLPPDSYQTLQYAVDGTSHTSNEIMANQSECPRDLPLHEQIAFAGIRSGPRLQWFNIARELRARSLSFGEEAVHTLLAQAVWQIGPLSGDVMEWHQELNNPDFGQLLLAELEDLFISIKANWLEVVSMRIITILTSRLLASTKHREVIDRAHILMREVRNVTFEWVHQLAKKLQQSEGESQLQEFQLRVCEMTASCRGTYDVDPEHAPYFLSSSEDVSILVECAILLHDNTPPSLAGVSPEIFRLIDRDRRLSHSLEALLCQRISESREGLDRAVTAIWAGYRPGYEWERLARPNDRWVTTKTAPKDDQMSQSVQINLLEGQLLVEGKPIGRLPTVIVTNPIYHRILGHKILDVVPADMPGMDFATHDLICGHQIFFGFRGSTSLVIRAIRTLDSETFELIPHFEFTDDLPAHLIEKHVHWFNLSKSKIELRPIERLWESSGQDWSIHFSITGDSIMYKDTSLRLVDIRSPTMDMISARVRPLESRNHLTVTYSPSSGSLVVHLPRFRLSFSLNEGQLESQNMPGMLIDTNQSSGTMFGLSSQLVLCAKDAKALPGSRRVIIPYGDVQFKPQGAHIHAVVDTSSQISVRYQEYTIDTDMGRLVGNASMISRLYKIYLHAISSHCLPDPLTRRTGTEEALHELRSAGCLSFQKLGDDETELLQQIRSLTPSRLFYPAHLKVMQSVTWSNLAPTAQHYDFYALTGSIVEYANKLQVFHAQAETCHSDSSSADLLERAAHRNTLFYPEGFTGPLPSSQDDTLHISRDISVHGADSDECAAADVSAMVHDWPSSLATCTQLFGTLKSWSSLHGPNQAVSLSYSSDWLEPNLAETWISLYNLCRKSSKKGNVFQMVFSFCALAYKSYDNRKLIPTLLAFATVPRFRDLHPPSWLSYDLSKGFHPDDKQLSIIVHQSAVPFEASPEFELPSLAGEDIATLGRRRLSAFETCRDVQAKEIVTHLIDQWPCAKPHSPPGSADGFLWLFDIQNLMERVGVAFEHWYRNKELQDHIHAVQVELDRVRSSHTIATRHSIYKFEPCSTGRPTVFCRVEFGQLVSRKAPGMDQPPSTLSLRTLQKLLETTITPNTGDLRCLLSEFRHNKTHKLLQLYGDDLDQSRMRLEQVNLTHAQFPDGSTGSSTLEICTDYRDKCQEHFEQTLSSISRSLSPLNRAEEVVFTSGQWPCLTIRSLLSKLAFKQDTGLTEQWKITLISLAQAVLRLQRSQRLLKCAQIGNWEDFSKELDNDGSYQGEIPFPDWLLIQIDNNFLVRLVQIRVAQEMIEPSSNCNTALQLNMGEGKSSVIVPMVAAALSDGQRFVRVIVLKSLAAQMFQLLVERLSGLTNRRIFYMPFSRSATLTVQQVRVIQDLYTECMRVGGVLVTQPEHILSFKLMGIDQLFNNTATPDSNVADALLKSQRWLEDNSRDILDECDEILHVRYQLVYTIGQQGPLEGHPDRWMTIQQILSLVKKHAPEVQQLFPLGLELHDGQVGCYPHIRLLDSNAGANLVSLVVKDVMNGELSNCSFQHVSTRARTAALRFVTHRVVSKADADLLEEHCKGTGLWKSLLLLRGMFIHGILEYVLKARRWRVDYGLDPSRSVMAVPYRAKDVPSLRAEFGHPDVAIALTCFSYYYSGLSKSQLGQCFMLLYKQDNPQVEYEKWVRNNGSIPEELRRLSGINTKDPEQHEQFIFPLFHRNHPTIDFFLSEVVFPKGAKEFPEKLATSGWDLAEIKHHVTTGFSGTNDGRYLLPTSIIQDDPVDQLSTNAKVLTYLLQLENDHYLPTHREGEFSSAENFLDLLVKQTPEIRVLLDVGAQMLEFQNVELAGHWLKLRPDIPAAIFFNDGDEVAVLTRDGNIESFISSPFKQQLDKCLVYLDDAHTRGTDLKLPRNSRAAVTLGPKVTKDRLLQGRTLCLSPAGAISDEFRIGCMRMRKLGHGQSVMFFAPLEVDRAIRDAAQKQPSDQVKVFDVLRWAMLETCADVVHHVPHWAQQGLDHARRQKAWKECSPPNSPVELLKSSWLQREARTLEEMYGLPAEGEKLSHHSAFEVPELGSRCRDLGVLSFLDVALEEEQEREVNHEIEREHEVQRPKKMTPAKHQVHKDVRILVETGRITSNSSQFVSIFSPLGDTAVAARSSNWSPNLLATKDFSITIKGSFSYANSDHLRPVNWIISSAGANGNGPIFVILSPYEVNELLPSIRKSTKVHLHQYAPRVTQSMKSFDDLAFYCIPPLPLHWTTPTLNLRNQLNLWSGQLYFPNREMYEELCDFLGLHTKQDSSVDDIQVRNDGFISSRCHRKPSCPFSDSPVPFLKEFVSSRRKGMGYMSTHLGKILHGRLLTDGDFDR